MPGDANQTMPDTRTLAELRASEARYRLLAEHTVDVIWLLNLRTERFEYVSPSVQRLRGYSVAEVLQQTMAEVMTPESLQRIREQLPGRLAAFLAGHPDSVTHTTEVEQTRKDGSTVWTEVVTTLLRNAGGDLQVIGVSRDISMRKIAQEALRQSEQQLRFYIDHAGDAIYVVETATGRIRQANARALKDLGYSMEELLTLSATEIEVALSADQVEAIHRQLKAGEVQTVEGRHRRKDGTTFPVEITLNSLGPAQPELMISMVRNISTRKALEAAARLSDQQLRESQDQFRRVVESSPMGIFLYRMEGDGRLVLIAANAASDQLAGRRHDELIGKTIEEAFPHLLGTDLPHIFRAIARGELAEQAFERTSSDPTPRIFDVRVFPIGSATIAVAFIEITDRKRAQDLLLETEKLRTVAALAAGIAHQINNPLAGMVQNAQAILLRLAQHSQAAEEALANAGTTQGAVNAYLQQRGIFEMLEAIRQSGRQASQVVQNLLSYTRRDAGRRSVEMRDLVERTLELANSDIDLRRFGGLASLTIQREFPPDGVYAFCHASQIQEVLLNLLRNAFHATRSNSPQRPPELRIRIWQDGTWVWLELGDNGGGIAPEQIVHIFEPFFTTKPPGEGTGLGLFVSYHLVTVNHGGRMLVRSTPGEGAVFSVGLPIAQSERLT